MSYQSLIPSARFPVRATPCRNACAPSATGCARCQPVTQEQIAGATLLLGPHDADVAATLRHAVDQAGLTFTEIGPVFAFANVSRQLTQINTALNTYMTPYTRAHIRAAYAPIPVTTSEQALAAFVFAEPASTVLANMEYAWLRDALAEDWLFSMFQPIVDVRAGTVFAHEALLRARDPRSGQIFGAGTLIRAADELDLMHQLDQRARQVAIQGAAAAAIAKDTKVFINFMPNTIYDPNICLRTTMTTAAACGIAPTQLVFEVVETERIPDMRRLNRILDYYRAQGMGTAIDDMGAGFATMEYLTALRPDYVKLDRSLLAEAEQHPAARAQCSAIIATAQELGVRVIAEGIETAAQLHFCVAAGVDYVQGYFLARPATPPPHVDAAASALLVR